VAAFFAQTTFIISSKRSTSMLIVEEEPQAEYPSGPLGWSF